MDQEQHDLLMQQQHDLLMKNKPDEKSALNTKNIDIAIGKAAEQQINSSISCFNNGAELINGNIDILQNDVEYVNKVTAKIQDIKSRNKVLRGEYHNEPELKDELIEAIDCAVLVPSVRGDIEECDNRFTAAETEIKNLPSDALNEFNKRIREKVKVKASSVDYDLAKSYTQTIFGGTKNSMLAFTLIFAILTFGFFIAAVLTGLTVFIVLTIIAGILFFIYICITVSCFHTIKREFNCLVDLWKGTANTYLQQKLKTSYSDAEEMYKSMAKISGSARLEAVVNEALIPSLRQYNEAKKRYSELRNDSAAMDKLLNNINSACADFMNIISPEFRDYDKLSDIGDLLKAMRADNLKEAYTILEVRYRENARDEELRNFHNVQNAQAEAQTQAQLLNAQITLHNGEVQAYYAAKQAEYAAQTAYNTARTADNTTDIKHNTARTASNTAAIAGNTATIAGYSAKISKSTAKTAEYAAQTAQYSKSTSGSSSRSAEELKKLRNGFFGDDE